MFKKILIANRGEIAVRITRACQEMGIRTVAVYSEADANAMHVRMADEAALIGPAAPRESYLNSARIIDAARTTGAQAIHPGYGFLSENADFADAVRTAGLTFIGPSGESIRKMGSKTEARSIMQNANVPVVPGYPHPPTPSPDDDKDVIGRGGVSPLFRNSRLVSGEGGRGGEAFLRAAEAIEYPVLVKAAAGGGGKGMRLVRDAAGLPDALDSAQREAQNAFGDPSVFIEKYIEQARHVEFQVFGDAHGNVVHLFERECSIQRRHQKIIEESPSPLLDAELRERMGAAAVAAARAVNYENAGTIEFIVDPHTREFYFLEMNTRLQVEHPVTEWVTGLDLVKLQIRVAAGERLPFATGDRQGSPLPSPRGHAIECRVYAEDPSNGFLPAIGPVLKAVEPRGPGVRVDTGIETGDEVTLHYDPMIAKVIVHAETRAEAIRRMDRALSQYVILGLTTNIAFLRDVLAHPVFQRGEATTAFVERELSNWKSRFDDEAIDLALIAAALNEGMSASREGGGMKTEGRAVHDPWKVTDRFRIGSRE